jgi:TM2 domain-containing membrane protein YozV
MFCKYHTQRIAIKKCSYCEVSICEECEVILKGKFFCPDCANRYLPGIHLAPERNPWKAAVFSLFLPGLGQVYNGQLAKGLRIFFFCWLIVPWIYGVVDAFRTAGQINNQTLFARSATKDAVLFLLVAALAVMGVVQVFRFSDSSERAEIWVEKDLLSLSQAAERYYTDKKTYPINFSQLYFSKPPYVTDSYCDTQRHGFEFTCDFSVKGYIVTAKPLDRKLRRDIYTITTGGVRHRTPFY